MAMTGDIRIRRSSGQAPSATQRWECPPLADGQRDSSPRAARRQQHPRRSPHRYREARQSPASRCVSAHRCFAPACFPPNAATLRPPRASANAPFLSADAPTQRRPPVTLAFSHKKSGGACLLRCKAHAAGRPSANRGAFHGTFSESSCTWPHRPDGTAEPGAFDGNGHRIRRSGRHVWRANFRLQ